ncbi:serine/threonine-protein kinase [Arthrobacter sp. 260]|uniref:serine/threonine-protein kinase n=1 Tax=Arthrobacter sp. 260 TaxID=2735314 RepID=UPI001490DCD0|nr:serine/threonine-protein kinase [Arthrobacter sp. 260]NOJ59725.1 serine/threonine protein kinase [Arthrobacter sp. 260]
MDSTPTGEEPLNDSGANPPSVPGYRCERLLGTGGSAAVWLVCNDQGARFALKVLDSAGRGDRGVDVVRREQLMLSRFTHEHLLALHEVVQTAQGTALRMDYAAGGSLLNLVSVRGPLSPGEVVTVLTPMAQVLAYLHDGGAVHGDVSPGNILFTELGKPLLADLGIARLLGEGSHVATGTPGFQETPRDHDGLNTEADLFALAAVGWFALTGRIPGPASQRPPLSLLVPDTPEALVELISWGLESEPEDRPTAIEFARAVQRTATAAPLDLVAAVHPDVTPSLMTRRPDPDEKPEKKRRRRRRPASVVAPVPRRSTSRSAAPAGGPRRRAAPPSQRRVRGVAAGLFIALALGVVAIVVVAIGAVSVSAPDPVEAGRAGAVNLPSGTVPSGPPPIPSPKTAPPRPAPAGEPTAHASDTAPDVLPEALAGTDPLEVLPHLSRVRERAFETADPALLRHVFVPESAALAADEEVVVELAARGHVLTGLSSDLANLERIDIPPGDAKDTAAGNTGTGNTGTVAIAATATTSGYAEATVGGRTQRVVPQEVSQQLVFVLQRIADRWLIREVREP